MYRYTFRAVRARTRNRGKDRRIKLLTLSLLLVLLVAVGATVGMAPARSSDEPPGTVTVTTTVRAVSRYRGVSAAAWAGRFKHRTRQLQAARSDTKRVRRTLASSPIVSEAINLASVVYGNGSTLWALARCESTLNPRAQNASGSSGLMQFMPSTFASTPYGRFSIWSPYASALAAGWMLQHGRRSEWVC